MVENVLPLFQLMAERVGRFLWEDQTDEDSRLAQLDENDQNVKDSRLFKLAHLLLKIVPTELELMRIYFTNLKASTSEEDGLFIKQLLETSPDILREYLIHLQEHMITVITPSTSGARNIHRCINSCTRLRDNGLLHLIFSLPTTIKKMKLIKDEVSDLHEKIPKNRGLIVVNSLKKPVERKSLTTDKIIVGFEEETNLILRKLTNGPADLDVIWITGMPGSGKTTLAYKVYNDKSVSSHFDLRAWCTVDQGYDEKKLLDKIFNQVSDSNSKLSENIDVADKLRKQLHGKRYLIVLDDVWDTTTWDELTRSFPEAQKGSRIILTTREKEVALHGKLYTAPLDLRLLRSEESWELIEKRAFGNESCPDELLDVGKEIAENCKGLPLIVDLIAGVIVGREKKKSVWLEVVNNLLSFILKNKVEVMKVIEISFDHLPHHLKPCLLYFASRPKDKALTIYELKAVWVAGGFVEKTEEVVKIYVDDLISSSLVICFNEIGEYPTYQLHDLVHDYLFLEPSFIMVKDFLLNEICMLRYLRIGTQVKSLPISFSNLWNLEILWVENKESTLILLPRIWDLVKLRLLAMSNCSFFDMDADESILIAEDTKLQNLRHLHKLVLSYSKDTEDIFKRLLNLQVLGFDLKESWNCSTAQYWFPKLDFLTELEDLL
uniref:Uncharacterized protein n=1 Tax=Solanum lycopersicum TaxID=4081 RepID=A0A3Q7GSD8_SOLLC